MAHFAKLDENNIVIQVIVISNEDCLDINGNESEQVGIDFCNKLISGRWIQTSYNNNFRVRYAGLGYIYSDKYDAFIAPKQNEECIFDEKTLSWIIKEDK